MSHSGQLPSRSELNEFRNALAATKATYKGNQSEVELIAQLVDDPQAYVTALRIIINVLLIELDTFKRDPDEVLAELIESAAMQGTRK